MVAVKRSSPMLQTIGWREWVCLPTVGIDKIKAKIDTGARTSALHANGIKIYNQGDTRYVHCTIYPLQRSNKNAVEIRAPLIEKRLVRSSVGTETNRPVISLQIEIAGQCFPVEFTLVNRGMMSFRMLLGRQALKKRFLVDSGKSFLG